MNGADRKRHPLRGFLAGLVLGLGVTLLLIVYAQLPFGELTPWITLAFFVVLGIVVGMVGPARKRSSA